MKIIDVIVVPNNTKAKSPIKQRINIFANQKP
jgi:hypothetical protein